MADAPALTRLVRDVPSFLEDVWGRRPWHVAGADAGGFADLLSAAHVDHLLSATGLRAPAFRLVRQGRTLPTSQVTRRARVGGKPVADLVDVRAVHDAVAGGATLVLQALHRSFAPVAALCRDLETTLTHPVQANAYLTPPIAQGLNLHADPHDVFAVQTYGRKRWVVHPLDGGEPWDLFLEPGDVLYLPAGARHAAQTVGEPSLHLTIGVRAVTWRSLVERLVADALAGVDGLDDPLPVAWAEVPDTLGTALGGRLAAVREAVAARADDEAAHLDALRDAARSFRRGRVPDRRGGLLDLLEVDHLDDAATLRRRPDVPAEVRARADGRLTLDLGDRRLDLPAALEGALEVVLVASIVRPRDLDELMDEPSRLVLCRRLVREGLLTIVREDDDDDGDGGVRAGAGSSLPAGGAGTRA